MRYREWSAHAKTAESRWEAVERAVLIGGLCGLFASATACGTDDSDVASPPAAGASGAPGTGGVGARGNGDSGTSPVGSGGTESVPADEECPKQVGDTPRYGASCETIDNTCGVGTACGVCRYDETCDYYEDGPVWEFADPLHNTGRAECPTDLPAIDSVCTEDFFALGAPCDYCDEAGPVFAACLEGRWRRVTYDNCP